VLGNPVGAGARRSTSHPAAELEHSVAGGKEVEGLPGEAGFRRKRGEDHGHQGGTTGAPGGLPTEGADHPAEAAPTPGAEELTEEEAGGQSGAETEYRQGREGDPIATSKTSCNSDLHAVKLIALHTAENRERTMANTPAPPARAPIGRLLLLALVILAGLGLFFAYARHTPAVVAPAGTEAQP
jgi:hypothetical protein